MADIIDQTPIASTSVSNGFDPSAPAGETAEQKYQRLYAQPTAAATPTPGQPQADPILAQTLQSLQAELVSLRSAVQQPRPAAAMSAAQPESKLEWVKKIQEGDYEGAQASLAQAVQLSLAPQLERTRQEAYSNALNAAQVNVEVDRHLQSVRAQNPDIIPFERYLQGPVTERIQLAQQAGRIGNPSDFLREYKAAVDSEVVNLRNLGLQFRAAGKDDALSRTSDVLRSTPITPQQVQSNQTQQTASEASAADTTYEAYMANRRASENRMHGRE